ncbi:MAG: MFS transporter [Sandaracinobacter sp.]
MKADHARGSLSQTDVLLYASGSFGTGLYSTIPSVLLLYFCTETLRIPPAIAGIIVFVPKLWAVVWDPIVGRWSDRSRHRWGRRRPFLLAGLIGMMVSFVALFSPPDMAWEAAAVWAALAYFALATLYSLYAVPYIALPAELGSTAATRALLIGRRMIAVMIGVLAGAAGAPFLVDLGGGGREGYRLMSLTIGAFCLVVMALPLIMLNGRDGPASGPAGMRKGSSHLHAALRNTAFLRLLGSFVAQLIACGALMAALPYIVTRILGRPEGDIAVALAILLSFAILGVPIWTRLARRRDERTLMMLALAGLALAVTLMALAVISSAGWPVVLASLALVGIPFAGLQVLSFTLVAHFIRSAAVQEEAALTGVWTAAEKVGLAAGATMTATAIATLGLAGPAIPIFLGAASAGLCAAAAMLLPPTQASDQEVPST